MSTNGHPQIRREGPRDDGRRVEQNHLDKPYRDVLSYQGRRASDASEGWRQDRQRGVDERAHWAARSGRLRRLKGWGAAADSFARRGAWPDDKRECGGARLYRGDGHDEGGG